MKRIFDLLVSIFGLFILVLPLVFLAILIYFKLGSPIFFRQIRPGLYGQPFIIYKFRTMRDELGSGGLLLSDAERLTPFGSFMRATSLDELPELFNVLKGDMSLVGPRPLLTEYLLLYTPKQARRHQVRPGITGWAQLNGRNAISWEDKFNLDLWYVDNHSMWLDIKILFITLKKVLMREGINADGHATMPRFIGTNARE
jgi:lipopolysaccharide/colanic/teichoic acid biosynthesis glycosyltransferase